MREPVSTRAVARIVSEPPPSIFRAEANIFHVAAEFKRRGHCVGKKHHKAKKHNKKHKRVHLNREGAK